MNKKALEFGIKVVLVWFLLNIIPAFLIITPIVLTNKANTLLIELVATITNLITFSLALGLMFRNSKINKAEKHEYGMYAYCGLLLMQTIGLLSNKSPQHLVSVILIVSVGYLTSVIITKKV